MAKGSSGIAADQLRSFVSRVERLEVEIKELNKDKAEIYAEARMNGFDVKALKKVIAARRMDHSDRLEQDAIFDLYMGIMEGEDIEDRTEERAEESVVDQAFKVGRAARQLAGGEKAQPSSVEIAGAIATLAKVNPQGANAIVEVNRALANDDTGLGFLNSVAAE